MKDEEFCIGPGRDGDACGEPTFRGPYCQAHVKQTQRTGKMTQVAEKISLEEQFLNAADKLAQAGDDNAEYEAAKKTVLALGKRLGNKGLNAELEDLVGEVEMLRSRSPSAFTPERREKIRQAWSRARANGVRFGRPPKVENAELRRIYEATRSISATARVLKMSKSSVHERLFGNSGLSERRPRKAG